MNGALIEMTVEGLKKRLDAIGVPDDLYSLLIGGFPNEAYCLIKNGEGWEVYYSERGHKSGVQQFVNESEACEYLFEELKIYAGKYICPTSHLKNKKS
ncbi:hypothetical protein SAMN02910451_02680 [Butyrivibrio hungatei]|uniref:Uncharacterized protein n=2 Tax=Butyrivibrio hungatei TaxID=185008 RepID=A0A1G5G2N6_9FIRM|nr:hypothetical protein SAMN02910451_02680 [Butyrivibrio hungatei]